MEDNQVQTTDQAALGGEQQDGNTTQVDAEAVTGGQAEQKMLAQDDVNGLIAKETKKAQEKMLKQLGITDFSTAKEGMQKYNEWLESQKTDQQRKEEELTTYQTQAQQAEEKASLLESKLAAYELNVNADHLDDVLVLAKAKGKDDIKEAIAEVIERYPHFTSQPAQEEPTPRFTTAQHKKESGSHDDFVNALLGKK